MLRDPRLAAIADLYPFEPHYLTIDGWRMHYVDEGQGEPIVFLHGNPTWSFYFRDLIKGLRDRYRVIAPDHIGCGLSDKPQGYAYTLATHIENLSRLMAHLDLQQVTVAGHDWGGAIAFGWAARHSGLVRRFVVFNTAAFLGGRTPWRIRICRWPILGTILVRMLNGFAGSAVHMASAHRERMTRSVIQGYLLPYRGYHDRVGVLGFVRDIPVTPKVPSHSVVRAIETELPRLSDRPMIIFWGGQDFCFNGSFLKEWRRRFPAAEVHCFPDAGHYVVEDAHERILPVLRQYLERT